MTVKSAVTVALVTSFAFIGSALAQDPGPQVKKLSDGMYIYVGKN
jgi:hypothetical protein